MKIKISADSTCDLPQEFIDRYDIGITPLDVLVNGVQHKDGVDIDSKKLLDEVESTKGTCVTAAVNVAEYQEVFAKYLTEYDAIIQFHISSEMSSCYQNANIAAEDFENVYTVDTRSLSDGIGLLVLDAAVMAEQGITPQEIKAEIERKKKLIEGSFVIDTLEYLRRGGRCSSVAALGANLLSLHPCIELKDGKMGVGKKYRGTVEKSILKYIDERLRGRADIDYSKIFITHSHGFSDEFIDTVRARILDCGPFENIYEGIAGCTISCHCGPKTLGIFFYKTK